ncbi:MAG: ABC transporter permease [Actinobacteria bacterium]|nr:ABC transporter permease [Actinomycetota bacterium]
MNAPAFSFQRIFVLVKKTLSLRNPYILLAFLGPILYAVLFQFVLGLWKENPVVVVFEKEKTAVVRELKKSKAVELVEAKSAGETKNNIEDKKADIGVVFPSGIDENLSVNKKFELKVYVNGESLAKNRAIALATLVDAMRKQTTIAPKVDFKLVKLGEERALTLTEMFLPLFVILVIVLGSYLLPASSLVVEREKKTLTALLITPLSLSEVILGFAITGIIISLLMGVILTVLTAGFTQPGLLVLVFFLGSILGAEWGILLGLLSKDQTSMTANMKALNILLIAPALFYLFPDWPDWIAKLFPTYYITNPIFRIAIYGEGWTEVGWQVLMLALWTIIFALPPAFLVRRLSTGKIS